MLATICGRFTRIALQQQKTRVRHSPDEITSITTGRDLARLLPSEVSLLTAPELEDLFYLKFAEADLMQYDLIGHEPQGQGPIIIALDESGLMTTACDGLTREVWSKAVMPALLSIARWQRGDFAVNHFSGAADLKVSFFPKGEATHAEVIASAGFFYGGGTVFEPWMNKALELVSDNGSRLGSDGSHATAPEARNKRKQELFDIKVDEIVRKRAMKEALGTYSWPLERRHLDEVAKEFFRRLPASDQKTVCEVFGWDREETGSLRFDDTAVLGKPAALDDDNLARFLMLCSFAHYGANQYGNNRADQSAVVQLSAERGINHTLIDATARVEVCPKKYKAMHEAYLEIATEGRMAEKPVVYEKTPSAQPSEDIEHTDNADALT